jgi:hypothetical protein
MQTNSAKVANVPNALLSTLSSTNWINTYNAAAKIRSTFTADLAAITANSEKVAAVPDALPNILSSANWTSILNTVSSISYITKQELTDVSGISLKK